MARCPNCTRKVHIWSNHTGFCSKRCREESRSACLNCGKVGLFKHERLGCCSDECRFWYVTTLLGYDRDYLLTPAWDKVVYHVRLPSGNAEISSLQLDELEFERAHETILVIAAPAWISRQKVLAELPYQRFDNPGWQHLRLDGTLAPEEQERFRRMCYDDPLLYHKLGEHVFYKIRGHGGTSPISPATTTQLAPGGMQLVPQLSAALYAQPLTASGAIPQSFESAPAQLAAVPALQIAQTSQHAQLLIPSLAPEDFAAKVCALFVKRGYQVSTADGMGINTLLLSKGGKHALATYIYEEGMVGADAVSAFLPLMTTAEVSHGYVVTNGHFTLQVEDQVAGRPVQLIDGPELASLLSADPAATRHIDNASALALAALVADRRGTSSDSHFGGQANGAANGSSPVEQPGGVHSAGDPWAASDMPSVDGIEAQTAGEVTTNGTVSLHGVTRMLNGNGAHAHLPGDGDTLAAAVRMKHAGVDDGGASGWSDGAPGTPEPVLGHSAE